MIPYKEKKKGTLGKNFRLANFYVFPYDFEYSTMIDNF